MAQQHHELLTQATVGGNPSDLHTWYNRKSKTAEQAVLHAHGPVASSTSPLCANSGPVADYERPVALSLRPHEYCTAVLLLYAHCSGCSRRMQMHCNAMQNPQTHITQHSNNNLQPSIKHTLKLIGISTHSPSLIQSLATCGGKS